MHTIGFEKYKDYESIRLWKGIFILCLIIKPLIFYNLMDIRINLPLLWVSTGAILILLFSSFKKPVIPFVLYVAISALMFADLVYNSYFNGYISVNAVGSARYLPEVWGIVKEVIRPRFWILFWDLPILILGTIRIPSINNKKTWATRTVLIFILVFLILGSASYSSSLQSAGNLEFFSAHIKDVIEAKTSFSQTIGYDIEIGSYYIDRNDQLFGIGKGRNLVVVQMESIQNFIVNREYKGKEITPELNRLIREKGTLYFDNFYMQIAAGNTSDAEFAVNNSLYGTEKSYTYEIYKENNYRGLPVLLREKGYSTIAMHGYEGGFWSRSEIYPAMGFDTFIDEEGYEPTRIHGWGIPDDEFYMQSVDYLKNQPKPFYSFLISLSNHTPFEMEEEYMSLRLSKEHKDTRFGNYLNSAAYSDYAIGVLVEELKNAGIYDDSIIAIYGDHFGLAQNDENNEELLTEFLGKPYRFDEMAKIPLIIHIPGVSVHETFSIAGGHLDFLPTIAYLMGFEELDTVYLGQNLLTADKGFVAQNRYAPLGSFITDEVIFMMSNDRVFENGKAWRIDNGKPEPTGKMKRLYEKSISLITTSERYLEENILADSLKASAEEDTDS